MVKDTITKQTSTGLVYQARLRDRKTRRITYLGVCHTREELDALYSSALSAHKTGQPLPTKTNKVKVGDAVLTRTQWYQVLKVCQQAVYQAAARRNLSVEEEISRRASLLDPPLLAE
jgi:hypothetical protein